MPIKRGQDLPSGDHVLRHVSSGRIRRDENRNILGVRGDALKPKQGEGLSVNWMEYSDGDEANQIAAAFEMMCEHLEIKKSAVLAKINVEAFGKIAAREGQRVRFVYDPIDNNPGHSEIRRIPVDNDELLDLLASTGIACWFSCADFL